MSEPGPARPAEITVALDGRGNDRGPEAIIEGARLAAADGISVRIFGDPAALAPASGLDHVELNEAPDEISNDDEPVAAVRRGERASVVMAARDVAEGRSQALAGAGSTGATMTAALFALKRLGGVRRPALAVQVVVPGRTGPPTLLLDVGANSEARAVDLVQFAYLGAAFSRAVLGVDEPRVALLSVGEEDKKGRPETIEANAGLRSMSGIDFRGNVESRDLLSATADVIVCDGFTGNVALKTIEGTAKTVAAAVRQAAGSNPAAMAGGLLLKPALGRLRSAIDPDQTGGAILLGLREVAVVAHGSSGPDGIANAIRLAARAVRQDAVGRTAALLDGSGAGREVIGSGG